VLSPLVARRGQDKGPILALSSKMESDKALQVENGRGGLPQCSDWRGFDGSIRLRSSAFVRRGRKALITRVRLIAG